MSHPYKVRNAEKRIIAACTHAEDAASLASLHDGSVILVNGRIVWREGREIQSAGVSYDYAAEVIHQRQREHHDASIRRNYPAHIAEKLIRQLND